MRACVNGGHKSYQWIKCVKNNHGRKKKNGRANDGDDDDNNVGRDFTITAVSNTKVDWKIIMRKPINFSTLWKAVKISDGDLELNVNFCATIAAAVAFRPLFLSLCALDAWSFSHFLLSNIQLHCLELFFSPSTNHSQKFPFSIKKIPELSITRALRFLLTTNRYQMPFRVL